MAGLKSEGLDENMGFCAILTLLYKHLCKTSIWRSSAADNGTNVDVMTRDLMRSMPDRVKQNNKSKNKYNKYKQLYHLVILPILHYKMVENCNTNGKKKSVGRPEYSKLFLLIFWLDCSSTSNDVRTLALASRLQLAFANWSVFHTTCLLEA